MSCISRVLCYKCCSSNKKKDTDQDSISTHVETQVSTSFGAPDQLNKDALDKIQSIMIDIPGSINPNKSSSSFFETNSTSYLSSPPDSPKNRISG